MVAEEQQVVAALNQELAQVWKKDLCVFFCSDAFAQWNSVSGDVMLWLRLAAEFVALLDAKMTERIAHGNAAPAAPLSESSSLSASSSSSSEEPLPSAAAAPRETSTSSSPLSPRRGLAASVGGMAKSSARPKAPPPALPSAPPPAPPASEPGAGGSPVTAAAEAPLARAKTEGAPIKKVIRRSVKRTDDEVSKSPPPPPGPL